MTNEDPSVGRLMDQIAALTLLLNEQMSTLRSRIDTESKTTAQTLKTLTEVVQTIDRRIESTYVRKDVYTLAHSSVEDDVNDLKERFRFISRTVYTLVIIPILVGVIVTFSVSGRF